MNKRRFLIRGASLAPLSVLSSGPITSCGTTPVHPEGPPPCRRY